MTAEGWHARALAAQFAGMSLAVTPDEYAELIRLRLAHDPLNFADHTSHLDGVPLVVELDQGADQ